VKIFAICGLKNVGKSLAVSIMREYLEANDYVVKEIYFSNITKKIITNIFSLKQDEYYNFINGRICFLNDQERMTGEVVQKIVSNLRYGNNTLFINDVVAQIEQYKEFHKDSLDRTVIIIPDLRFRDEVKWCKANDVTIFKIKSLNGVYDTAINAVEIDDFCATAVINNTDDSSEQFLQNVQSTLVKYL